MSAFAWIITIVLTLTLLGTSALLLFTLKYYWGERGKPPLKGEERKRQKEDELKLRAAQIERSKKTPWKTRNPNFFDNRKNSSNNLRFLPAKNAEKRGKLRIRIYPQINTDKHRYFFDFTDKFNFFTIYSHLCPSLCLSVDRMLSACFADNKISSIKQFLQINFQVVCADLSVIPV